MRCVAGKALVGIAFLGLSVSTVSASLADDGARKQSAPPDTITSVPAAVLVPWTPAERGWRGPSYARPRGVPAPDRWVWGWSDLGPADRGQARRYRGRPWSGAPNYGPYWRWRPNGRAWDHGRARGSPYGYGYGFRMPYDGYDGRWAYRYAPRPRDGRRW
jgi:hypothetical protein